MDIREINILCSGVFRSELCVLLRAGGVLGGWELPRFFIPSVGVSVASGFGDYGSDVGGGFSFSYESRSYAKDVVDGFREDSGLDVVFGFPCFSGVGGEALGDSGVPVVWYAKVVGSCGALGKNYRWFTVGEAKLLSGDLGYLAAIEAASRNVTASVVELSPLIVLRHATAVSRASWGAGEDSRPLAELGAAEAVFISSMLHFWAPRRVISSPWRRCVSTVASYAVSSGIEVEDRFAISELGYREDMVAAVEVAEEALLSCEPIVLCTHRPVLPAVFEVISRYCSYSVGRSVPKFDPYLDAAHFLVAHRLRDNSSGEVRIVAVEQYGPVSL